MAREYDQATLQRLQKLELDILKDFIFVCDKYDLTWFSFAGTAIGALRHGGTMNSTAPVVDCLKLAAEGVELSWTDGWMAEE